jgi:hypothetical protein
MATAVSEIVSPAAASPVFPDASPTTRVVEASAGNRDAGE